MRHRPMIEPVAAAIGQHAAVSDAANLALVWRCTFLPYPKLLGRTIYA